MAATPPPDELSPVDAPGGWAGGRRRGLLVLGAIVAALLVFALIAVSGRDDDGGDTVAPRDPGPLDLHAWVPYWALDDAIGDVEVRADSIHQLSPLWFGATDVDTIEADANTPADEAAQFLDLARQHDIPLVVSVFDRTDAGVMASILADADQRAEHVDALVSFAAENDVAGLDIDYEQFAFADGKDTWEATRPNWVAFVTELAARLHDDGRLLTVSIPPVYDAGRTDDSGYWVYDYGAIAPVVDGIRVMAYDYSTASSDPGPIAPLEWVDRLVAGTSAAAGDPSKLVLGIPLYGYNWPIAVTGQCPADAPGVTTVTERTVDELAAERGGTPVFDPVTYEWSFQYDLVVEDGTASCTQRRQVNYVGADGAQQRMQRAVDAGFAGVALFALGYGDEAVWGAVDTIAAELQPASAETTVP